MNALGMSAGVLEKIKTEHAYESAVLPAPCTCIQRAWSHSRGSHTLRMSVKRG